MRGLKKKRRIQIILMAFVALAVSTGMIGYAMRDGINLYREPSQVIASPPPPTEVFRIGGLVMDGSLQRGQGKTIRFDVTDNAGAVIPVAFTGVLPDLFSENQGTIATGRMIEGVFEASEVLAKHDESYMPKEVLDTLKRSGEYRDPNGS